MKHKHKWQFLETISPVFVAAEMKEGGSTNVNYMTGHWTKTYFKFVCECGKTKKVEAK